MSEPSKLTVIIVSWNVKAHLIQCLDSLIDHSNGSKITVVDNASTDGSAALIRDQYPSVQLIVNDTNRGFAAAVNQGISRTTDGDILLLNPDCIIKPNAIEYCLDKITNDHNFGIIGCRLRNSDGSIQGSVRRFPKASDQILILLKLHRIFPNLKPLRRYFMTDFDYYSAQKVDQVKGAFFMISRDLINKIGLFDERFWIWFEEVDYCRRAKLAGFSVFFTPAVEVIHASGESFQYIQSIRRQRYFSASLIKYFSKYHPGWPTRLVRLFVPVGYFIALMAMPLFIFKKKYPLSNG